MIKQKSIFLDNFPFFRQRGESIDHDVEILNVICDEASTQTECQYIGNEFVYKPLLWLESQEFKKVKEINMIYLESKPTSLLKKKITESFPNIKINFFNLLHVANYFFFELGQQLAIKKNSITRKNNCYFSIATIRLPRFYLLQYCQKHGISNFGAPYIEQNTLQNFKRQIENLSNGKEIIMNYVNKEKRPFGFIPQPEFEIKQMPLLADSRITIVSHYPWYDYISHFYDEKISLPIAAKTLPFFFDNKDANLNLQDIGFKPYIGFNYSGDKEQNFVTRWKKILDDNRKFLINDKDNTEIYNLNKNIIDYNYNVLIKTNWKSKALRELDSLPSNIKDIILENTDLI